MTLNPHQNRTDTPSHDPATPNPPDVSPQDASTPSLALEVLRCLVARGPDGGTCQEIERTLRKGHRAVSARLRELEKGEYISKTSRKRRIWGGRLARVYMANGTAVALVADATRTRVE